MEANAGMVAESHKRNELVRILHDSDSAPKPQKHLNVQICQICGDGVGLTADGDVFVAYIECEFSVFRPCYEHERKDGNQSCPQCKTRYKRHKGSSRVDGDDDEEDVDDLTMSSTMLKELARLSANGREKILSCLHPLGMILSDPFLSSLMDSQYLVKFPVTLQKLIQ